MNVGIILAGGVGSRMGLDIPKQFLKIREKEVIGYTMTAFQNADSIDRFFLVAHEDYWKHIEDICTKYDLKKFWGISSAGDTRQESVFGALDAINSLNDDDIVLIHDGVRAMITPDIIDECIIQTKRYGATTLAQKSINTIIYSESDKIQEYINRDYIYNVQTPQSFRYGIIYEAHKKVIGQDMTDDTQIAMKNGINVHIIENNEPNLKLTTREDIMLFDYYLSRETIN